jgi:hypothetical protein
LNEFTNSCEFVLVNQGGEGEEDVVWDRKLVTKEYAEAGTPGTPGESSIVTQLGNPSSIIQLVNGAVATKVAKSYIQARKGSGFVAIDNVTIKAVRINGTNITAAGYPVALTINRDTTEPYTDSELTFTLKDGYYEAKEQTIEVDLNVTIAEKNYIETKTIIIQKSGGENAIHLELVEDSINVTFSSINDQNGSLGITNKAVLYDGTIEADGETYSAVFENCEGTCNTSTGEIVVNYIDPGFTSVGKVTVTSTFKGTTYKKAFVITKTVFN